jgi:nucleoid DNA-binding protein
MAIAKRGQVEDTEIEDLEEDEVEETPAPKKKSKPAVVEVEEDDEEEVPAKPAKKGKKQEVVEEEEETEDEEEEAEGIIAHMVEASKEYYEEPISKAEAKRMFKVFCDALGTTIYKEGEVRFPNIGVIELDAVPAKQGASWIGVSEEDKAAMLKKDPKSKGKAWETDAKWTVKARFFQGFKDEINALAEENGDTASAYLESLEAEDEAE